MGASLATTRLGWRVGRQLWERGNGPRVGYAVVVVVVVVVAFVLVGIVDDADNQRQGGRQGVEAPQLPGACLLY